MVCVVGIVINSVWACIPHCPIQPAAALKAVVLVMSIRAYAWHFQVCKPLLWTVYAYSINQTTANASATGCTCEVVQGQVSFCCVLTCCVSSVNTLVLTTAVVGQDMQFARFRATQLLIGNICTCMPCKTAACDAVGILTTAAAHLMPQGPVLVKCAQQGRHQPVETSSRGSLCCLRKLTAC